MSVLLSFVKLPDADIGKVITNTSATVWFCRHYFHRLYSIYRHMQQSLSSNTVKEHQLINQINCTTTISPMTSTGRYDNF